jgi:hypothetical protein
VEGTNPHESKRHQSSTEGEKPDLRIGPEPPYRPSSDGQYHDDLDGHSIVGRWQDQINEIHHLRQRPMSVTPSLSRHPLESVLGTGLRRLLQIAIPLSLLALVFPASSNEHLLIYVLVHLTVLQIATFAFVIEVSALLTAAWFGGLRRRWLASAVSLVAATVGFSALLTLATSAAARYDVSLQFLQLLSSMDIAWVVAALYLGARQLWGKRVGVALGSFLLAACVWSIAVYLDSVGFTNSGGWLVDGDEMLRIVLPSDLMAAVLSVTVLLLGGRKADYRTEQARPQS